MSGLGSQANLNPTTASVPPTQGDELYHVMEVLARRVHDVEQLVNFCVESILGGAGLEQRIEENIPGPDPKAALLPGTAFRVNDANGRLHEVIQQLEVLAREICPANTGPVSNG